MARRVDMRLVRISVKLALLEQFLINIKKKLKLKLEKLGVVLLPMCS